MRTGWILLLLVGLVWGAPLPSERPRPSLTAHRWMMRHGSSLFWARFYPCGQYYAGPGDKSAILWHGNWVLQGDILTVEEFSIWDTAKENRVVYWSVCLDKSSWTGERITCSGFVDEFSLEGD